MSRDVNASLRFRAAQLQNSGMFSLFEVQVQATPAVVYEYWTDYNASISYFKPETDTVQVYDSFPIKAGDLETDDGTKVPAIQIKIGAVDQQIVSYIESNDALRRHRVRRVTVSADEITNASAYAIDTFYIDGATIDHDNEEAVFELTSKGAVANITVPMRAMRRDQCGYKYKNASTCQYSGSESTCRHTKDACASKSNVINFGAFPGIGTRKVFF